MWWDKHRRAWEPFRPYEVYTITVVPVVAGGVVLWLGTRDEADAMTTVVYPTIAFGVTALVLVVGFHLVPYVYRRLTGRTAVGRGRTLVGLDLENVKGELRKHNPHTVHNIDATMDSVEIRKFKDEMSDLLADCGWEVDRHFGLLVSDKPVTDLEIRLPTGGNPGLEALAIALTRVGYRVTLIPSEYNGAPDGAGSPTAHLYIGEATH